MKSKTIITLTLSLLFSIEMWSQSASLEELGKMRSFFKEQVKEARVTQDVQCYDLTIPNSPILQHKNTTCSYFSFHPDMKPDSIRFESDGESLMEKYDTKGNLQSRTFLGPLRVGQENLLRRGDTIFISKWRRKTTQILNEEGDVAESFTENHFGAITNRTKRESMADGYQDFSYELNMQGDTLAVTTTLFDEKKRIIRWEKQREEENFTTSQTYNYDQAGHLLQMVSRDSLQEVTETHSYDNNGRETSYYKWVWHFFEEEAPRIEFQKTFTYEKEGIVKVEELDQAGNLRQETIETQYDRWGNVLRREESERFQKSLTKRTLTMEYQYYE